MESEKLKKIGSAVSAPAFAEQWLERFYEPSEIRILSDYDPESFDRNGFTKNYNLSPEELERLLKRCVFRETGSGKLTPADFHARYDIWALFEGFKDIPVDIRNLLNHWELEFYIESHRDDVNTILKGKTPSAEGIIPRYLLLEEACDVLAEAEQIFLWPCNCRSMMQACSKSVYTCLRFDNSQGQGYEISREKAWQIVIESNKKGLMQSGELGRDSSGRLTGAICNCCADCCFPHLLAKEMKAEKFWPLSRYQAVFDHRECNGCGLCSRRCPFHAFTLDRLKSEGSRLSFFPERCRGCGLCSETCPRESIRMVSLAQV